MPLNQKDFRRLKGWIDNERHLLPQLSHAQKVEYLRKRMKRVLLLPLSEIYRSFEREKQTRSTLLCMGTIICCSIEALGKFLTGKTASGNAGSNFREFVKQYMNPDFPTKQFKGMTYLDILWKYFRNGLAHGFAIKDGGFERAATYFHIKDFHGKRQLEINPTMFYEDFIHAVGKYLDDLKRSSPSDKIHRNFRKAFNDVFISGI